MSRPKQVLVPLLALALGLGVFGWRVKAADLPPAQAMTLAPLYAAPVERVETHLLERGETLSEVLGRARFSGLELADLLLGMREHVNPRRLVEGVELTVRRLIRDDSPRSVDLRVNADTTLRLRRHDYGWDGDVIVTPVVLDTIYTEGRIEAGMALFQAIVHSDDDAVPIRDRTQLVHRLADVYEFKLDFTREIQPGDSYRLVYEREVRPDLTARSQRILSAEIINQGRVYPAIWYSAGKDAEGYYDLEGRPLASGFSRYPVDFRITSSFSQRRYHPVLGIYRAHLGTDFGAPAGTPVGATANGTVTFAGVSGGYGNMVVIKHPNGYETRYAHLRSFAKGVRAGVAVRQKQTVGYVGSTGLATGAHLHYELRKGGRAINVRTASLPTAPPLEGEHRGRFEAVARERQDLLERATRAHLAVQAGLRSRVGEPD